MTAEERIKRITGLLNDLDWWHTADDIIAMMKGERE